MRPRANPDGHRKAPQVCFAARTYHNRQGKEVSKMAGDSSARNWAARSQGSGTFVISKPKRNKAKMRTHRLKNKRRAR